MAGHGPLLPTPMTRARIKNQYLKAKPNIQKTAGLLLNVVKTFANFIGIAAPYQLFPLQFRRWVWNEVRLDICRLHVTES